jgi:hypothetical protein
MGSLEVVKIGLVHPDSLLQLLYILCAPLPERSLSLAVPLLAFLGSGIDRLAAALPLGLLAILRLVMAGGVVSGGGVVLVRLRGRVDGFLALIAVFAQVVDRHVVGHAYRACSGAGTSPLRAQTAGTPSAGVRVHCSVGTGRDSRGAARRAELGKCPVRRVSKRLPSLRVLESETRIRTGVTSKDQS